MSEAEKNKLLKILKYLFIERTKYDCTYYDLDNRICVDTSFNATKEEIELVKKWLEEEEKEIK